MVRWPLPLPLLFLPLLVAASPATSSAQRTTDTTWVFSGQLTGVWTAGNSETSTFGLATSLQRRNSIGEVKLEAGGIRTDASKKTRRAVGTATSFTIEENERRETTAERYFARIRFDRKITGGAVVFAGLDVLRNTFAGIDSRTLLALGAGHVWVNNDESRFKTDYGVTYTFQEDVVDNPFLKSSFPGTRITAELRRKLTNTARLETTLVSDLNFSDTDDLRFDFNNALPVAVSSAISLKPSLHLAWRNRPASREVELFTADGGATGTRVAVPLEKLDSFFTLAVVVTL